MKIIDDFAKLFGYVNQDEVKSFGIFGGGFGGFDERVGFGYEATNDEATERLALKSTWVYSNTQLIANLATSGKLNVLEIDGESTVPIDNHIFEQLFQSPSGVSWINREYLVKFLVQWYLLRGEAFAHIIRDKTGQILELIPIPSSDMMVVPHSQSQLVIRHFLYKTPEMKTPKRLNADQVFYWRNPHPFYTHKGISALGAYRMSLKTDLESQRWNLETFSEKEVMLRTILSLPEDLNDKQFLRAKDSILMAMSDYRQRFLIARAGDITPVTVGLNPKDAEFLTGRDFTRKEIDRAFGIPEGYWSERANRANAEAARYSVIDGAVMPLLDSLASTITSQILPSYGDNLKAQFDDLRPQNREMLVSERELYWMVQTVNECRADIGMDALTGEEGNTLYPLAIEGIDPGSVDANSQDSSWGES